MNTPCPHCQTVIEIDPETLAALQGHAHFQCPSCNGRLLVPPAPVKVTAAAAIQPAKTSRSPAAPSTLASAHLGLNRNMLILGSVVLLVLGGLGFFLASGDSGDTFKTEQKITNEIINNSFFQNLIASGQTKAEHLNAISFIRPFREGFIGISEEPMSWAQAEELAKSTASEVLVLEQEGSIQLSEFIKWTNESFKFQFSSTFWVTDGESPKVLDGEELLTPPSLQKARKVVLQWNLPVGSATVNAAPRLPALPSSPPERASQITEILAKIEELERELAALNGKFVWRIHNDLRHHYHGLKSTFPQISDECERIELWHCNEIFMRQIGDEYILNCISAWSAKTDPVRAAESLQLWTEKYPQYPYLAAACLLRSAELLGPGTARGKEILLQFSKMEHPGLDGYRAKAEILMNPVPTPGPK